jgi:hypothetical protein
MGEQSLSLNADVCQRVRQFTIAPLAKQGDAFGRQIHELKIQ